MDINKHAIQCNGKVYTMYADLGATYSLFPKPVFIPPVTLTHVTGFLPIRDLKLPRYLLILNIMTKTCNAHISTMLDAQGAVKPMSSFAGIRTILAF